MWWAKLLSHPYNSSRGRARCMLCIGDQALLLHTEKRRASSDALSLERGRREEVSSCAHPSLAPATIVARMRVSLGRNSQAEVWVVVVYSCRLHGWLVRWVDVE